MKKKPTLTIGIPAYNEEGNIKFLLQSLLKQKIKRAILQEIIVISDGSTDGTVKKVSSVRSKAIRIKAYKNRKGLYARQNEMVKLSKSDTLVLIDADTLPENANFIDELIKPIIEGKNIGIVSGETINAKPRSLIEKILANSHEFKKYIFKKLRGGNNVYLCHGRARAFSKQFYSVLNWPKDCPEDSYSYFFCLKKGFKFVYEPKAKVLFRAPSVFNEHAKKSKRFLLGKQKLEDHFSTRFLKEHYSIPISLITMALAIFFVRNPLLTIIYLLMILNIKFFYKHNPVNYSMWDASKSSKMVVLNE